MPVCRAANSGKMVKESNITSTFKAFCNNAGVEYKPSHTCRRSYVTNCLDKGMKLAVVSKNVGHKNKSTTLNTYYKCKNDYEDNLAIQNEIFKIYDFDFGSEKAEAPENASSAFPEASLGEDKYFTFSLVTIKGGGPLTIK